jgi:hypothetical protein
MRAACVTPKVSQDYPAQWRTQLSLSEQIKNPL